MLPTGNAVVVLGKVYAEVGSSTVHCKFRKQIMSIDSFFKLPGGDMVSIVNQDQGT